MFFKFLIKALLSDDKLVDSTYRFYVKKFAYYTVQQKLLNKFIYLLKILNNNVIGYYNI